MAKDEEHISWDKFFEGLKIYRQIHGDCNVPKSYGILGDWVLSQRSRYRDKKNPKHPPLRRDQINRLNSIGFDGDESTDEEKIKDDVEEGARKTTPRIEKRKRAIRAHEEKEEKCRFGGDGGESTEKKTKDVEEGACKTIPRLEKSKRALRVCKEKKKNYRFDAKVVEDALSAAADGESTRIYIGSRVGVYWPDDDAYYEGVVSRKNEKRRGHIFVEYDDGDREWLDANRTKIKILDNSSPNGSYQDRVKLANVKKGSRVLVWWPAEKAYFAATVTKVKNNKSKSHFIEYDDGDREWANLLCRKFRLLDHQSNHIGNVDDGVESKETKAGDRSKDKNEGGPCTTSPNLGKRKHAGSACKEKGEIVQTKKDSPQNATTDSEEMTQIDIGSRVAVYWPGDDAYYEGIVAQKEKKRARIYVEYDDGDEEWVNVKRTKLKILDNHSSKGGVLDHANVANLKKGSRVSVWWPSHKQGYYAATVTEVQENKSKPHFVEYDGGDCEWVNLRHRKFRFFDQA